MTRPNDLHFTMDVPMPDEGEGHVVRVQLRYSEGGMNYYNYSVQKRGFYLSYQPGIASRHMFECSPMDGVKMCVLEAPRRSSHKAAQLVATIRANEDKIRHIAKSGKYGLSFPIFGITTTDSVAA